MTDEERLAEMLLVWEESYEQGTDVSAAELSKDRPDLLPALAERIELLRRVIWMSRPPMGDEAGSPLVVELPPVPLAGRYRLDERVGVGGHGQVFRGFDLQLQRTVAVKIPRPDFLHRRPDRRDAFVEEARRLARFSYPGIVQVYDVGVHDGHDFIVSEWIDGIDLARLVAVCDIPRREAARIVAEAARHLHYAHRRGFVHRDVKPANILLQCDGRVVVTDFGIAAQTGGIQGDGGAMGTLSYMAPERLTGGDCADVRADVYGLGVVLCELLTGCPPFAGATGEALRQAITNGDLGRSLQFLSDSGYPQLTAIFRRCTAITPANRYQSAEAVAEDLERLLAERYHRELDTSGVIPRRCGDGSTSDTGQLLSQVVHKALAALGNDASTDELRTWVEGTGVDPTTGFASIVPHVKRWALRRIALLEASHELLMEETRKLNKELALREQRLREEFARKEVQQRLARLRNMTNAEFRKPDDRQQAVALLPLRVRALLAAEWVRSVLPVLTEAAPDDHRPLQAVDAVTRWALAPTRANAAVIAILVADRPSADDCLPGTTERDAAGAVDAALRAGHEAATGAECTDTMARCGLLTVRGSLISRIASPDAKWNWLFMTYRQALGPVPAFDPKWRTPETTALANDIMRRRDLSTVPLLAEQLRDAGCLEGALGHMNGDCTLADWTLWNLLGLNEAPASGLPGEGD